MQEGCRLQRALPSTDNNDLLACKAAGLCKFGGMRGQVRGETCKLRRPRSERSNASRDHNALRSDFLTILKRQSKAFAGCVHTCNLPRVNFRHSARLKPPTVGYKMLNWNGRWNLHTLCRLEGVQR